MKNNVVSISQWCAQKIIECMHFWLFISPANPDIRYIGYTYNSHYCNAHQDCSICKIVKIELDPLLAARNTNEQFVSFLASPTMAYAIKMLLKYAVSSYSGKRRKEPFFSVQQICRYYSLVMHGRIVYDSYCHAIDQPSY